MNDHSCALRNVLILADESADWKVAGLRQLDRLVLALNELARKNGATIDLAVFWKPACQSINWLPQDVRLTQVKVRALESMTNGRAAVLTTRLFVARDGLEGLLSTVPSIYVDHVSADHASWLELFERFEKNARPEPKSKQEIGWRYLETPADVATSERLLLQRSGKTQDGLVARYLNRPISRLVTRFIFRFPISPTAWTVSILVLPILAGLFFLRGNYISVVIGTLVYQLHSVLDGCDGEIARAKYLESRVGAKIDDLCDVFAALIFVTTLGIGIGRPGEGFVCAAMIAIHERLLHTGKDRDFARQSELAQSVYPRHRNVIERSGVRFLGDRSIWWFLQVTKRDVGILVFVFLALIGAAQWIIHLWLAVTAIALTVTLAARFRAD